MRSLNCLLAVVLCGVLGPYASSQQLPSFKADDAVDFYSYGKWSPCVVVSPASTGGYKLRCGSLELQAKADPNELRAHITVPMGVLTAFGVESAPTPVTTELSVGARYGTRDPRGCDRRPEHFTAAEAKEVFTCDAEHEFNGKLYLVSEVSLEVAGPRPFNATVDTKKLNIDHAQLVVEILATYNNFQCDQLPASHFDNPRNRNCTEFHAKTIPGACFKSTVGDWHCVISEPTLGLMTATAKNVAPPTLVE